MEEDVEKVFQGLTISKILIAILEQSGSVSLPYSSFADAGNEDKELQVDFDEESAILTFRLRENE